MPVALNVCICNTIHAKQGGKGHCSLRKCVVFGQGTTVATMRRKHR